MAKRNLPLENLPSNNRTAPNKQDKIIEGEYTEGTRTGKLSSGLRDAGNGMFERLVVPGLQSLFMEIVDEGLSQTLEGISTMVFGRSSRPPRRRSKHTSYNRMYNEPEPHERRGRTANRYVRQEAVFEDIFFHKRDDARRVLHYLQDKIHRHGQATIGDYYAMVGKSSNITHEGWGWVVLDRTRINYSSDGYVIDFPEPDYLN